MVSKEFVVYGDNGWETEWVDPYAENVDITPVRAGLRDAGNPVLHGHTRSTEKVSFSACGTPQLHVGWDAWGRPVRFHEIVALLKGAE